MYILEWNQIRRKTMPKKRRLGPQKGFRSLGLEKMPKIVSSAETKKLKEKMVGPQEE